MIVGMYKMHTKEINIKNRVCNYYFNKLIKAKKILIDKKNYEDFVI